MKDTFARPAGAGSRVRIGAPPRGNTQPSAEKAVVLTKNETRFLGLLENGMSRKAKELMQPRDILKLLQRREGYVSSADELTPELARGIARVFERAASLPKGWCASGRPADAIVETFRALVARRDFRPEELESLARPKSRNA